MIDYISKLGYMKNKDHSTDCTDDNLICRRCCSKDPKGCWPHTRAVPGLQERGGCPVQNTACEHPALHGVHDKGQPGDCDPIVQSQLTLLDRCLREWTICMQRTSSTETWNPTIYFSTKAWWWKLEILVWQQWSYTGIFLSRLNAPLAQCCGWPQRWSDAG